MQLSPVHERILVCIYTRETFTVHTSVHVLGFTHAVTFAALAFLLERKLIFNTGRRRNRAFIYKLTTEGSEMIAQQWSGYTSSRLSTTS